MDVISLNRVAKYYKLYRKPSDRLKEALNPFGKRYHSRFYALKGVSLSVRKGEVLGVIGRNGSGKSTLLKLLSNVLVPDEGEVCVRGKLIALLELGAGFNPEFTGRQNVYFYGAVLGLNSHEMDERIDSILAFADIGQFIDQPLKTYSSGMKSRLGFAVSVHVDPEILVLDEVLAVGDAQFQRKCYSKVREFLGKGKTVIFVSHSMTSVIEFCTRAVLLHEGMVILDGVPKVVADYYQKLAFASDPVEVVADIEKARMRCSSVRSNADPVITNAYVKFKNIHMCNTSGKKLVVVKKGETIVIKYHVEIMSEYEFQEIRLGFMIKNVRGTPIGGARDYYRCDDGKFSYGNLLSVTRKFKVNLLPSDGYTIKLDAIAEINGKDVVLSAMSEALTFDVIDLGGDHEHKPAGLVDLQQNVNIVQVNGL